MCSVCVLFRTNLKDDGSVFDFCILLTNVYHFNVYNCQWPRGECCYYNLNKLCPGLSPLIVGFSPRMNVIVSIMLLKYN